MRGTVRLPWGDQLSQIVQDGLKGGGWPLAYGITASPGPTGQGGKASVCVCVCLRGHIGVGLCEDREGGARLKLKSGGKLFGSGIKNEI